MDRSIKRMLKLIEEEGDSFAKKAEIYLQKRPELVSQVEDFYRMFRSLAERYENATAELRRCSTPSEVRSQCSAIPDVCSEPPSRIPSPDHRLTRRLSAPRPGIFDIIGNKEGDEMSTMDSDSDSDDSSNYNFSSASTYGNYRRLRKKITELEDELRRVQMENGCGSHEKELRLAKEKIRSSEEEMDRLKMKLQKYESRPDHLSDEANRIGALEEKLAGAEEDVKRLRHEVDLNRRLQEQFESEQNEWNSKRDDEKGYVSKLQYEISRYKVGLSERDQQILMLQEHVSKLVIERTLDYSTKELELECMKTEMEDEIKQLKAERDEVVEKVNELEEEVSLQDDQIDHMNERLCKLHLECETSSRSIEELGCRSRELEKVIEKQQEMIEEGAEENRQTVRQLRITLEHYRNAYQMLRLDLLEQKKPVKAS